MEDYLIKSNAETNPEYGCNPYERPIEEHIAKGIINLDKPSTSRQALHPMKWTPGLREYLDARKQAMEEHLTLK